MRFFAPQTVLLALVMLASQAFASQAASSCHNQEVVGQEASARSWISARGNARAKWITRVNSDLGQRWSNWRFAGKRGYICWAEGSDKICKAAAVPCNGRMKSASLSSEKRRNNSANERSREGGGRDSWSEQETNEQREARIRRSVDEARLERLKAKRSANSQSELFSQTLADSDEVKRTCNGRSTRIAGKLLYDLKEAKKSAQSLWSEYVSITKGRAWSDWQDAKRREIKCVPDGLKIKCEISAIACMLIGKQKKLRHADGYNQRGGMVLPTKRPDFNSFAYDEAIARDPGEYGDGHDGDEAQKIELPAKRDGFSLPWLSKPPVGRPEPEDEEGGPFGQNAHEKEFDISGLPKEFSSTDSNRGNQYQRNFNKQGSLTPALPVKRPMIRQAAKNQDLWKTGGRDANSPFYQEDYQRDRLKKSGFAGVTLPQLRPKRKPKKSQNKKQDWNAFASQKSKRFSQNFNTDNEEEEDSFGGGRSETNKNKRLNQQRNRNTGRGRDRDVKKNEDQETDAWGNEISRGNDTKKSQKQNWNFDSDTEEKRPQNRNNSRHQRKPLSNKQGRNYNINANRSKAQNDKFDRRNRRSKSRNDRNRSDNQNNNRRVRKQAERNWNQDEGAPIDKTRSSSRSGSKRSDSRSKSKSRPKGNRKVFDGWTADNEGENRSVSRRRGGKGSAVDSRKFKGKKFGGLESKTSKVNYMSNSGVMTRPNTFYGCKEEEVASWGKAQPTKPQARQSAIKNWQKVIYNRFGKNWSDWMKAGSSRVQCGNQKNMKKCVAIGNPCGVVALKKADDFAGAARCRIYALKYKGDSNRDLAQAKQNAMNVWEKKIEKKYGAKWSDWFRSMEHTISCKKRRGKMRCQASAIPCSL